MFPIVLLISLTFQIAPIGADSPDHEPQMATDGSTVAMAFGAGKGIYCSISRNRGAVFARPVKVAEEQIVPLTRHRGPRIVFAGRAIVITAVAGKMAAGGEHAHGLPTDGDLLAWRSTDGGVSWSRPVVVNDVPGAPTEGLHSLTADANGNLFAVWLDKRSGHGTALFGARSTNYGLTWSKNVKIYESADGTICECCHPSVTTDARGGILVMYRNWLNGSRDMYLSRSADGVAFSKPEKLGNGTWKLNACPMDGGGLAAADGKVVTAWRRAEAVFFDEPGHEEVQIGTGKDVALSIAGDRRYVIWTHGTAIELWNGGKVQVLAKAGAYPAVLALPQSGLLAAWEENGGIQVRRL